MDPASSPESRNSPLSGLTRHHAPSKEEPISKNVLHREKAMGSMRVCESDPRWAFHLEKLALALPLAGYSLISLLKMSPNPRYWDRSFAAHAGRFFEVPAKWPHEKMSRDWIKACEIAALLTTTSDHLARISQLGTGNSVGVELTDTADKAKRLSQNTLGFATLLSTANWSRYES